MTLKSLIKRCFLSNLKKIRVNSTLLLIIECMHKHYLKQTEIKQLSLLISWNASFYTQILQYYWRSIMTFIRTILSLL